MPDALRRTLLAAVATASLHAAAGVAGAQQFTITTHDISCGSGSYTGPVGTCGAVGDGGYDAFDGYGYYGDVYSVPDGLALARRTEAFTDRNLYRFVDTFTNTSGASFNGTVQFYGNLGSDGYGSVVGSSPFYRVSADATPGSLGYDPVLALVWGNNAFAASNVAVTANQAEFFMTTTLSLLPGQSVSLMSFALLARDVNRSTVAQQDADNALALGGAQALVASPYYDGLSAEERARIVNFDEGAAGYVTPEPGTWALMGTGLVGLVGVARRRRQQG